MEFEPKMPPVALVEPQASVDYRRTREMTIDEIHGVALSMTNILKQDEREMKESMTFQQ